ncbi:MAG: FxLYD domain-containing protein [Methanolinea sp.]
MGTLAVTVLLLFAAAALSGCISARDLVPEPPPPGIPLPVPTTPPQADSGRTVPLVETGYGSGEEAPRHLVATPYGYVLTRPSPRTRISIIEVREETVGDGEKILAGKIKNDEPATIGHITVQFNLYNANGQLVGNTYASVNSLAPQKTWKFATQPFPARDYHHYELAEIFTA